MFRQKLIFTVQVYKGMHDTSRYLPSETSTSRQSQTVFQKINSHLDQRKKMKIAWILNLSVLAMLCIER